MDTDGNLIRYRASSRDDGVNKNATGKKAKKGPELAQRIRGLLIDALDLVDSDDKSLKEILAGELRENPLRYLELASKYVPRNVDVTGSIHQTIEHRAVSEADERIREMLAGRESTDTQEALPH